MKPTWKIIEGDNLEVMRGMADGSASVCITDPSYSEKTHEGAKTCSKDSRAGKNGKRAILAEADKLIDFNHISLADLRLRFEEIGRITKRWTIATMDYKHIVALEAEPPEQMRFVRFGIWRKPDGSPQFTGDRPGMGWEGVAHLHHTGEPMRWNGGGHHGWYETEEDPCEDYVHNTDKSGIYPTIKPYSLIRDFVRLYTEPEETVIDPWCGSGRVGEVCIEMGRNYIGMDIDPYACVLARSRLSRASGVPAEMPRRRNVKYAESPLLDSLATDLVGVA